MKKLLFLLLLLIVTSANAGSNLKFKKIKFRGYKYEGIVDKKTKIPSGEGTLYLQKGWLTPTISIKGYFSNNIVENARLEDKEHELSFMGNVEIDPYGRCILKSGGELTDHLYFNMIPILNNYGYYKFDDIKSYKTIKYKLSKDYIIYDHDAVCSTSLDEEYTKDESKKDESLVDNMPMVVKWESYEYYNQYSRRNEEAWKRVATFDNYSRNNKFKIYVDGKVTSLDDKEVYAESGYIRYYSDCCKHKLRLDLPYSQFAGKIDGHYTDKNTTISCKLLKDYGIRAFLQGKSPEYEITNFKFYNRNAENEQQFIKEIRDSILPVFKHHLADSITINFYDEKVSKWLNLPYFVKTDTFVPQEGSALKEKQAEEKRAREEERKKQAEWDSLYKRYGKKYVEAACKNQVLVGMHEDLLNLLRYGAELVSDSGDTKSYNLYSITSTLRTVNVMRIYIRNHKVSSIYKY